MSNVTEIKDSANWLQLLVSKKPVTAMAIFAVMIAVLSSWATKSIYTDSQKKISELEADLRLCNKEKQSNDSSIRVLLIELITKKNDKAK